jgi:hypothetical protein
MNRPYIDDKLIHFGFSLGMNLMSYSVVESGIPVSGNMPAPVGPFTDEVLHPRVSQLFPGFSVGFITDIRLARHLNLRFTPELHFGERIINYKSESGNLPMVSTNVLCMPISMPLMLKWSADRESNYRPYLIAGGGVSYDVYQDKQRYVLQQPFDYFVQVGFGCDFYFSWFKLCPEIKYQLGFNNALTPLDQHKEGIDPKTDGFYTDAIKSLRSHMVTLVFNFE